MTTVDEYIKEVIKKGDNISSELERIFSDTLRNSPHVDIISSGTQGVKVIRAPENSLAVVYSVSGDPNISNPKEYSHSVVNRLVQAANNLGTKPVAFANVIDARSGDKESILPFAESLAEKANECKLAVTNGEFAILGDRLAVPANISATAVAFIPKDFKVYKNPQFEDCGFFEIQGVQYGIFNHEGKAIYMNSDGVGTKTEFYEREGYPHKARRDSFAMKLDDLVKIGANAKIVSDIWETNEEGFSKITSRGFTNSSLNFIYLQQMENLGNRLVPYKKGEAVYNVSGSAVSVINEDRLKNLPVPKEGDYLIAIRGKPNPRSNGITDKRKIMIELFDQNWHENHIGREFMKYLSEPSIVFYGLFKQLIEEGLATSVYHMSGGAFKGKLASPIAKQGLFVKIKDLFPPDWRELTLAGARFTSAEDAYSKWPMGNDGFITSSNPYSAINAINSYREISDEREIDTRVVGRLEKNTEGKTGIEFKPFYGNPIYFSGS